MFLLLVSFVAGLLTVLAPCILPLLPVIVGGSVAGEAHHRRAITIVISLAFSVLAFTLLLKASTLFISVPETFWKYFAGGIVVVFGLVTFFPGLWEKVPGVNRLNRDANMAVGLGYKKKSIWGDIIIGAALGPVFTTCSPTYFIVLATVLPSNVAAGLVYLFAYVIGLALSLFVISFVGQRIVDRLGLAADPNGIFKKTLGILFILVGVAILTGVDKRIETAILDAGFFDVTKLEQKLLDRDMGKGLELVPEPLMPESFQTEIGSTTPVSAVSEKRNAENKGQTSAYNPSPVSLAKKSLLYPRAPELVSPSGFINTQGKAITLADYKGKNVVLLDVWTYSCINCQRTLPHVTSWDVKYRDDGLVIIGLHTPEFAFEKVKANVEAAVKKWNIGYPVVMDNEYATWNAYKNSYWPRKYLIDIDGFIRYDHAGEGAYDETEQKIVELLKERSVALGTGTVEMDTSVTAEAPFVDFTKVRTPERYLGYGRTEGLINLPSKSCYNAVCSFEAPVVVPLNTHAFIGTWKMGLEETTLTEGSGSLTIRFSANKANLVAVGHVGVRARIHLDGKLISALQSGADVENGEVTFGAADLYNLVDLKGAYGEHELKIEFLEPGVEVFAFTFG